MKNFISLVGTIGELGIGVQDPHELIKYCSPIYDLCVSSHFWPFTKANLILENFNKNLCTGQALILKRHYVEQLVMTPTGALLRWDCSYFHTSERINDPCSPCLNISAHLS